jgi:hypothetical protein
VKLPVVAPVTLDKAKLLRFGAPAAVVLWLAGSGYWLADDLVAQRRATPEEVQALRWQLGTNKLEAPKSELLKTDPAKPEQAKPEAAKPEAQPPKSINEIFSVRKGGVEPFDPLNRTAPAAPPVMVADWPRRILAGLAIASMPVLGLIGGLLALWLQKRKAARLVAEAAEAKRQREIEFKRSFAPKRPVKHYQSKNHLR